MRRLPIWAKFGMQQWASGLRLETKFHQDRCIASPMRRKNANVSKFRLNFHTLGAGGPSVYPLTNMDQIRQQTVDHGLRYTLMPNFIPIRLLCHLPRTKYILANFDILMYPATFTDMHQVWRIDLQCTLMCPISSRLVYSVTRDESILGIPMGPMGIATAVSWEWEWECGDGSGGMKIPPPVFPFPMI